MSTKSILTQTIIRYSQSREGAYPHRKRRVNTMYSILDDLYAARLMPSHWKYLAPDTIRRLVTYWRYHKKLSAATVMNKLSVFRHFCNHYSLRLVFPMNETLRVHKKKRRNIKITNPLDLMPTIQSPLAKIILQLICYFGLTCKEAMLLNPFLNVYQGEVIIGRDIAFNAKQRHIPILTNEQQCCLQELKKLVNHDCLLKHYSYQYLNNQYRTALQTSGIVSNIQYRCCYVNYRLVMLHDLSRKMQRNILLREMGLSKVQLRSYFAIHYFQRS